MALVEHGAEPVDGMAALVAGGAADVLPCLRLGDESNEDGQAALARKQKLLVTLTPAVQLLNGATNDSPSDTFGGRGPRAGRLMGKLSQLACGDACFGGDLRLWHGDRLGQAGAA